MSSNTHHPLASDGSKISPDCVGSICGIINQKNEWLQKHGTSSLLPANSTSSNSSSLLHDQLSKSFQSSLVLNDGSNSSNKSSNLNETNQSTSAFLLCQDTHFSFKSPSLVSITTSDIASKTSDCCSHHGSNSMSSLSSATAKHLRNVVPYTIIPFEKQGIQRKCRESQGHHLRTCISSINYCSYRSKKRVKILIDAMATLNSKNKKTSALPLAEM